MRLLIDTHILLWLLTSNSRLSPDLYDMLADRQHTVFVSAVSAWEIVMKVGLGKLTVPPRLREWLPAEISAAGLLMLPIQFDDALGVELLPRHHTDPFDRLLISQAQTGGLTLVSADRVFSLYDMPLITC